MSGLADGGDGGDGNAYYLEAVELDADPELEQMNFEEVDEDFDGGADDADDISAMIKKAKDDQEDEVLAAVNASKRTTLQRSNINQKATVVDDFIRNFLIKLNMKRTLDTFNTEWYELSEQGKLNQEDIGVVADIYQRNEELDEAVKRLRKEVDKAHEIADKARGTWDKFRKERDFHRMHHRRVVQEKNMLIRDMKRLKKHYNTFEPALTAMRAKYEGAMKDKMLIRLEKDRIVSKMDAMEAQLKSYETMAVDEDGKQQQVPVAVAVGGPPSAKKATTPKKKTSANKRNNTTVKAKKNDTPFPDSHQPNPNLNRHYEPMDPLKLQLRKTFRGHEMAISGLDIHPTKEIVATASDDGMWKMWSLMKGELIMSGEGHKDWLSSCKFHPKGHMLATTSGDGTVKLWDFNGRGCRQTFTDHTLAVWDCDFNYTGDFIISASQDQTARLWDVNTGKCKQTLRGHVDSINSVVFQPHSMVVCTASGDKTVSLWDVRSGLCIQTFYGHDNAVLGCDFSLQGNNIASSDSDGVVKVWDVRTVSERLEIAPGQPGSINAVKFDNSGTMLFSASDHCTIDCYELNGSSAKSKGSLVGPEGAVQALALCPQNNYLVSAGSDEAFRVFAA